MVNQIYERHGKQEREATDELIDRRCVLDFNVDSRAKFSLPAFLFCGRAADPLPLTAFSLPRVNHEFTRV